MDEKKLYRLVFTGSFGDYFLWHMLMVLGIIPVLGSWFQFLFLKWLVRNTTVVPLELTDEDIRAISESRKTREKISSELKKEQQL